MPKVAADDVTVGAAVYWRASDGAMTTTASGNTKMVTAVSSAGTGTASVRVRLNGSF